MGITETLQTYPEISIVIISIGIMFFSTLITKYFTDQKKMKELRERQKELNKMAREFKNDLKKIGEINTEVMKISMEMMRHSFKPLIFTMIPLFLLFWWVGKTFSTVLPKWIWYYLIAGIIASIVFRKLLKVV